jgi:hypothetical protein
MFTFIPVFSGLKSNMSPGIVSLYRSAQNWSPYPLDDFPSVRGNLLRLTA